MKEHKKFKERIKKSFRNIDTNIYYLYHFNIKPNMGKIITFGLLAAMTYGCVHKGNHQKTAEKFRNYLVGKGGKISFKHDGRPISTSLTNGRHYSAWAGHDVYDYQTNISFKDEKGQNKKIIDKFSDGFKWVFFTNAPDRYQLGNLSSDTYDLHWGEIRNVRYEYDSLMKHIPKWYAKWKQKEDSCRSNFKIIKTDFADTIRLPNDKKIFPGINEKGIFYGENLEEKSRSRGVIRYLGFPKKDEKGGFHININDFNTNNNINKNVVARRSLLEGDEINTSNKGYEKKSKPGIVIDIKTLEGVIAEYTFVVRSNDNKIPSSVALDRFEKGDTVSFPTVKPLNPAQTSARYKMTKRSVCGKTLETTFTNYLKGYQPISAVSSVNLQKIRKVTSRQKR